MGAAQSRRILDQNPKYRPQLPGDGLMTPSTSDVPVCRSKLAISSAQFVEQPRILDGDDRLISEVVTNSICLSVKGSTFSLYKMKTPTRSSPRNIGTPSSVRMGSVSRRA